MIYFLYTVLFLFVLVAAFAATVLTLGVVGVPVFFGVVMSAGLIANKVCSANLML